MIYHAYTVYHGCSSMIDHRRHTCSCMIDHRCSCSVDYGCLCMVDHGCLCKYMVDYGCP